MYPIKFRVFDNAALRDGVTVNLRCPVCRQNGTFENFLINEDVIWTQATTDEERQKGTVSGLRVGVRRCPNTECYAPILVIIKDNELFVSLPPEVVDFDDADVPTEIASSMGEAILCHGAGCYKASAIMVRRTLEEICEDGGAKGKDLKARMQDLGDKVTISKEMIDAADELRILGNDAAHVKAKEYDDIGKEEAEIAIELAKEIVKAVYQQKTLANRLRKLKKMKNKRAEQKAEEAGET